MINNSRNINNNSINNNSTDHGRKKTVKAVVTQHAASEQKSQASDTHGSTGLARTASQQLHASKTCTRASPALRQVLRNVVNCASQGPQATISAHLSSCA